ncbi:hypothetical protein CFH99_09010 [Nocardioides aromaticivorans]|uniref:Peptidase M15C domain-containing protein n=1 Tax=Nocardioides aromaticivorans TaxID=200618 RepID=A0ABX7PIM9_9ACTN|nr:M15 family metallopeptidase [Nocardioides aromaticivorans]QSR25760.1 hypothetical protein CFH99_09010 [Nocardioides aromaticivorans]
MLSVALACIVLCSGCAGSPAPTAGPTSPATASADPSDQDVAMARPGPFESTGDSPDILVQSPRPIDADLVARAAATQGVARLEQFSLATFYREGEAITYAAVDPATFRQFTPGPTAVLDALWDRVADGEIGLRPDLRTALAGPGDFVTLGNDDNAQRAHVAAYAPLVPHSAIGALLNERWADRLHLPKGNALVVSTRFAAPGPVVRRLRRVLGTRASVSLLAPNVVPDQALSAVLTGGSVAAAVGSFSYTANPDGTVDPEARWVRTHIRTERVPILGAVTCNRAMLPALRRALTRVVEAGLATEVHADEYGGCYVPRFIAHDPARGLSFHTFGTAIDLNVPGNRRGTAGTIDRRVVAILVRCGFAWGGTWRYTDPMHFELAAIRSC